MGLLRVWWRTAVNLICSASFDQGEYREEKLTSDLLFHGSGCSSTLLLLGCGPVRRGLSARLFSAKDVARRALSSCRLGRGRNGLSTRTEVQRKSLTTPSYAGHRRCHSAA